jgi:hypothetical protein
MIEQKRKRGRPKGSQTVEMQEKKRRAMNLIDVNPTLSAQRVADHVGVSQTTVLRWFEEAHLKRWFC